jgi:hypothetical protein
MRVSTTVHARIINRAIGPVQNSCAPACPAGRLVCRNFAA